MTNSEGPAHAQSKQPTSPASGSAPPDFDAYPELQPIRSWGVDAAIHAFGIEAEDDVVDQLNEMVGSALVLAYAPIASIARETNRVAERARAAHLLETARISERTAIRVADVAAALQVREEAAAAKVAQAASDAAEFVAASVTPGGEEEAVLAAVQVATTVHDAAAAKSAELAHAATLVADAAALAAAEATGTAKTQEVALELEVFEAAAAVQAIALNACYQVAVDAAATTAEKHLKRRTDELGRSTPDNPVEPS